MPGRPKIRINQLGYLPDAPQRATWVTDATGPQPFAVRDGGGAVVTGGRSAPWSPRPEPTSGLAVHVPDLTGLPPGDGYRVTAGDDHRSIPT